jgi:hypothetical protein
MASTTRMLKTSDIAGNSSSSIIVRLMMAINDTSLVNVLLKDWCGSEDRAHKWRRANGRLFLAKLQMAYVFEAMDIVSDIRKSTALKDDIQKLGDDARSAYDLLCKFIDSDDYKMLAEFRNSVSFHYDGKRAARAVNDISKEAPDDVQGASSGSEVIDWYYALGDKAYERIVTKYIFKVSDDKDVAKESDAIANKFFDMSERLIVFGGALLKQIA